VSSDSDAIQLARRLAGELAGSLGARVVRTDPASREAARTDRGVWSKGEPPAAVVVARDEADVRETLSAAHALGVPVVVRGAGSGLSGGAEALSRGIVLDLSGLDRILAIAPEDGYAIVQAGVVTADLDRAAAVHGLAFAPDPASAELSTVGGNIATNAGGLRCVKYGTTRDAVLALKVALADGSVIELGARTRKNVAGLDLLGLMVGSEGTLGVVLEATVRLIPRPFGHRMALLACASMEEVQIALSAVTASGVTPSLFEMLDRGALARRDPHFLAEVGVTDVAAVAAVLLIETDGSGAGADLTRIQDALDGRGVGGARVLSDGERTAAYAVRRGELTPGRADAQVGAPPDEWWLGEDMTVPASALAEFLGVSERAGREEGVELSLVAHIGDGNLHPSLTVPRDRMGRAEAEARLMRVADAMVRCAVRLGGSVTGEHGIGTLKREWMPLAADPVVRALHASVKAAFDPRGILGPGRAY
jgi:glycolate oxidase